MRPDFSLSNATRYSSQQDGEQTTSSVLPRVNIDPSELTRAPQNTGLHRRSRIEAIIQSSLGCYLSKFFQLRLDLRENKRQIDTYRKSFESCGVQDKPLEAYEQNKVVLRTLQSNTNDNFVVPIARHNKRRYTTLNTNLGDQLDEIYTLLKDNLNRAIQSFSSIGPLLNFVDSELSEFITLPNTYISLQQLLERLFDEDQAQYPHSGNVETLQLIYRFACSIREKLGLEQVQSAFLRCSLKGSLDKMAIKYMFCRLDSLNTMESLIEFVENHECNIKILSGLGPKALVQHMIKTIDRLPGDKVYAESLFLLNAKMENLFKDNGKTILKKAFSVLSNELTSLADGRAAFHRVNIAGLGKDAAIEKIFIKMCTFIQDFDDALDTFNIVTDFKPDIYKKFFDDLYEKVVSYAVSADHFYRLAVNPAFDKDISKFCLKGLAMNPDHIGIKNLHKKLIEDKIYQQFDKTVCSSREVFIKNQM